MAALRHRQRLWAAFWLVFQTVMLSGLAPRECCADHRIAAAQDEPSCHKKAAATYCPMHKAAQSSQSHEESSHRCAMRGTCGGPIIALFALLSTQGVLPESFALLPDSQVGTAVVRTDESLIRLLTPPETPPPRA